MRHRKEHPDRPRVEHAMTPPLSQPLVPARLPPQHRRALMVAAALALAVHALLLLRWPALTQQVRAGSAASLGIGPGARLLAEGPGSEAFPKGGRRHDS